MAAYWDWWDRKVSVNPKRWEYALLAIGLILTFLPALLGVWAFAFYPVGWIFILPGYHHASKKNKRAAEEKADQLETSLRIKKLILLGQKEKSQ